MSGKKEILVNRLLEAASEFGCLPASSSSSLPYRYSSSPTSPAAAPTATTATSPSDSEFSFSLPGVDSPPAAAAAAGGEDAGDDNHAEEEKEEKREAAESVELSPEAGSAAAAAAAAGGETDGVASVGGGRVEGGGGEYRPAAAAAAGAGLQETAFRRRLKARARQKESATTRQAEELFSSSGSGDSEDPDGAIRRVGSGGDRSRSSGGGSSTSSSTSGNRSRPILGHPAGGPGQGKNSAHRPSSSQQRAIAAGKAAVAEAVAGKMGPPAVRTPLGSLGSGNVRSATSDGEGRGNLLKAGGKSKQPATSSTKQQPFGGSGSSGGSGGVSGNATAQRKAGHGYLSGSSAEGCRMPLGAGNSSSSRKVPTANKGAAGPRSAAEPGKADRARSSANVVDTGRGRGSTIAAGGAKRPAASVASSSMAAATSDHAKRPKVNGVNSYRKLVPAKAKTPSSFAKPTTKPSAGAPSFMKPTKNSGARTFGSDRTTQRAAPDGGAQ